MKTLFRLPDFDVTQDELRRCLESIALRHDAAEVVVAGSPATVDRHRDNLKGLSVEVLDVETCPDDFCAFVDIRKGDGPPTAIEAGPSGRFFWFDFSNPWERARLHEDGAGSAFSGGKTGNVFQEFAARRQHEFAYFPYGYVFYSPGLGPIDGFGFRIDADLDELVSRPASHKLIVVFGGSAAWSLDCLHHETFSYVLESSLNERLAGETRVTVLNFGQHGHLVLNEMMTYMLFVRRLRPDVVISHGGFNDLLYGMIADGRMLAQGLAYQINHEMIAMQLSPGGEANFTQADVAAYRILNYPQEIVSPFMARLREFQSIVQGDGAQFVVGVQPFLGSKGELSHAEQSYIDTYAPYGGQFGEPYANMRFAYENLQKAHADDGAFSRVDFPLLFECYGENETLFVDFCHTTPSGDARIAAAYCEHLLASGVFSQKAQPA